MKNYYIFIEFDDSDKIRYWRIAAPLPYRQSISLSGFRNLQHKILKKHSNRWYYFKFQNEFEYDNEWYQQDINHPVLGELYQKYLNLPIIDCVDLYDFYNKIGWDRKKKKFINP